MTESAACVGEVLPMPTLPPLVAKYAEPVDPTLVEEAWVKVERPVTPSVPEFVVFANAAVPVNVGDAEYTKFPLPVAPVEVMPSNVVWPVTERVPSVAMLPAEVVVA